MKILSRKEAKAAGEKFYFTGKPCPNGHVALRRTHNGECRDCYLSAKKKDYYERRDENLLRAAEYRAANREKINKTAVDRYWANPELFRKRSRDYAKAMYAQDANWHKRKADARKDKLRAYYKANKDRISKRCSMWRSENRGKVNSFVALRRAKRKQATPRWADLNKIAEIYRFRVEFESDSGIKCDVDHIIPLQGENVCGLHVHWNLRVTPQSYNRSKANSVRDDLALAYEHRTW